MPLFAIPFPAIDPVAISIGPLAIRWYALAYIVGLLIGWRYCLALTSWRPHLVGRQDVDDFLVWATLGVVLGGRLRSEERRVGKECRRRGGPCAVKNRRGRVTAQQLK